MGSAISVNKTKSNEKYLIKDREKNEEIYTDISYVFNTDTSYVLNNTSEKPSEKPSENTSQKPVTCKDKTQFICPNNHSNCKNQRCWW